MGDWQASVGAQFYNLFNHLNFRQPLSNVAGNVGIIQTTVNRPTSTLERPRVAMLRYVWSYSPPNLTSNFALQPHGEKGCSAHAGQPFDFDTELIQHPAGTTPATDQWGTSPIAAAFGLVPDFSAALSAPCEPSSSRRPFV